MKKSDLKDGMIVKTGKAIYLVCGDKFLGLNGYMGFENYDENLKIKGNGFEILNINFVYETECWGLGLKDLLSKTTALKLIWERKKEIDWSKVPKWTKVQVKFPGEIEWENYLFTDYLPNNVFKFHVAGFKDDEFTGYEATRHQVEYCRIHESVEIKEEWYKEC
ncbi:hypothetical protein [Clostridium perfringens]|uniref:hypothetical protein n=1 Tax=Clostridium perfringens TaxID=1502 RepID=UPI0039EB48A6